MATEGDCEKRCCIRDAARNGEDLAARLDSGHPGTKIIVGDGPAREKLAARYPHAIFMGARFGSELASIYSAADVFVFPSRTDTFGLVMIEALECGTPVAAYPVTGPVDVLTPATGAMDADLDRALVHELEQVFAEASDDGHLLAVLAERVELVGECSLELLASDVG